MDLTLWNELPPEPTKPEYDQVELPNDITLLSSEQLAEVFTKLTAWADYIATEHTKAQVKERSLTKQIEFRENSLLVERMGSAARGERITLVRAEISLDPQVRDLAQNLEEVYAYRKMVEVLLNNHERNLSLVSREITRRTNDKRANRSDYGI